MSKQFSYQFTEEYDSTYEIKGKKIRCFSKEAMSKKYPDGNIPVEGEISKAGDKAEGSIKLADKEFGVYPSGTQSSFLYKTAGYMKQKDGYLAILAFRKSLIFWLIGIIVAAALAVGGAVLLHDSQAPVQEQNKGNQLISPKYEDENLVEIERSDVLIVLPAGKVTLYDGLADEATTDAELSLFMTPEKDGTEHTVLQDTVHYENGRMQNAQLDFTALDFELLDGDYEGRFIIERADNGEKIEKEADIRIVTSTGGSVEVNFSGEARIDLKTGEVQVEYSESNATHNSMVQLLIVDGEDEYLIAESGMIYPGTGIKGMKLTDGARDILAPGGYDGKLRAHFFEGEEQVQDVKTDIAIRINVK